MSLTYSFSGRPVWKAQRAHLHTPSSGLESSGHGHSPHSSSSDIIPSHKHVSHRRRSKNQRDPFRKGRDNQCDPARRQASVPPTEERVRQVHEQAPARRSHQQRKPISQRTRTQGCMAFFSSLLMPRHVSAQRIPTRRTHSGASPSQGSRGCKRPREDAPDAVRQYGMSTLPRVLPSSCLCTRPGARALAFSLCIPPASHLASSSHPFSQHIGILFLPGHRQKSRILYTDRLLNFLSV